MEEPRELKRTKLSDVAKRAGVSVSTVSLVLAGRSAEYRIADETQERVRQATAELNYSPSLLHRSVRQGRTGILSFYNSYRNREAGDLYMDRLSAAIEHAGGRKGYNILVHCHFEQTLQETYDFLNGGFADGLILFSPAPDDPLLVRLRSAGLPTVVLNPRGPESTLSSVTEDSERGMALVADALFEHGHRNIGIVIQSSPDWSAPRARERWLRHDLRELGIPEGGLRTIVSEGDAVADLRAIMTAPRPTAVFVWNDRTAYHLLDACEEAGVRVPEDLSIVGYDGIRWSSESGQEVTSVWTPLEDMADAAVGELDRILRSQGGPQYLRIPGELLAGTTLARLSPP